MSKRDNIRKSILAKRASLAGGDIQSASLAAASLFLESPLYHNADRIGFFMAHNGEIDPTHILNAALRDGKECYLPTLDPVTDNSLIFVNYAKGESLVRNRYQILEPVIKPTNVIGARLLDVVLLPLVCIDNQGNRLGMGKGYYDRTFEFRKTQTEFKTPQLVGFGYEFQKQLALDGKSWDVPMDFFLSEQQLMSFNTAAAESL